MPRIIFCDLDDTLLNHDHVVTERSKTALHKCWKAGYKIGYITARSPRKLGEFLIGLPCDFIASYNGAVINIENKKKIKALIDFEEGRQCISKVLMCEHSAKFSIHFEPYILRHGTISGPEGEYYFDGNPDTLPHADMQRIRIEVKDTNEIDFSSCISENMRYYRTAHHSAIIVNRNANKGYALKKICEYYDVSPNDAITFGDDLIDLEMFQVAGTAVAMANALTEVKQGADYITASNDEDGVAEYLEKFCLN